MWCQKVGTNEGRILKSAVVPLSMNLQEVLFECTALMLQAKTGLGVIKEKIEKLNHNQKYSIKQPNGANARSEMKVKHHAKRGHSADSKLINLIMGKGKVCHRVSEIAAARIAADVTFKSSKKETVQIFVEHILEIAGIT